MRLAIITLAMLLAATVTVHAEPKVPSVENPDLRSEILRRVDEDQAGRIAAIDWMKAHGGFDAVGSTKWTPQEQDEFKKIKSNGEQIDADNTKWLKSQLDEHGWPTNSQVGNDGAHGAWLLVQHADRDTKFQRRCLDLMAKLSKEEVAPQDVAYLTDRVLLAEGKKQLYGTQFLIKDGKQRPQPIDDEANVDARRAEVGLPSLAEYAKLLDEQYGIVKK